MDVEENMQQKFIIPEEIPANERTAFHGAAAAAAKAGKKSFSFAGKTHPVTMKKDTATKIADQKEAVNYRKALADISNAYLDMSMARNNDVAKNKAEELQNEELDNDDKPTVKKVIKGLKKAVATHQGQVKTLSKDIKDSTSEMHDSEKEKEMDPEDKKEKLKKKTANAKNGDTAIMNPKMDNGKEKGSGMEQKEQTIRDKMIAVLEGDRAKHYKGAAEAETMDDKYKGDGAKKMKKDHEGETVDKLPQAFDDASKAGRATKAAPKRKGDAAIGDKAIINAISKAYQGMK